MGTLSKNFDKFGRRIGDQVGTLKTNVSHRLDDLNSKHARNASTEGGLTRRLEHLTAALPSSTWLALAGVSILGSLTLQALNRHRTATFVGQMAPTFLLLGIYNKIVKVQGSDRFSG